MSTPHWKFFFNSQDTWEAMLNACATAHTSIDMEAYCILDDTIGKRFIDLFIKKQKEGVRVRLLCDGAGSYPLWKSSLPQKLKDAGVEIQFFNPLYISKIIKIFSWYCRTHRKILIVDNTIAFNGGVNIADQYRGWQDIHVKTTGSVVSEVISSFNELWNQNLNRNILSRLKEARGRKSASTFVTNAPYLHKHFLSKQFIKALNKATSYIHISTAYFVPTKKVTKALYAAQARGVKIKLLLPQYADVSIVDIATKSKLGDLLKNNITIFLYTPSMLHGKMALVDGTWATMGSMNVDYLSLYYNYESNFISTEESFIEPLKENFEKNLTNSIQYTLEMWNSRGPLTRIKEFIIWPIHTFL